MIILRNRFFSESEEDEPRLSYKDEKAIEKYKKNQRLAKLTEDAYNGDKDAQRALGRKAGRKQRWGGTLYGGLAGGLYGGLAGYDSDVTAAGGAALGAAGGAALGYLTLGAKGRKEARKRWRNADKKSRSAQLEINKEIDKDRLNVANGNMTKKEFLKKWGEA